MKKALINLTFTFFIVFSLTSCGGGEDGLQPKNCVPKEAYGVFVMDPGKIADKGITLRDALEYVKSPGVDINKILGSGIDTTSQAFLFMNMSQNMTSGYAGFTLKVSDNKKFGEFLKGQFENVKKIDEDGITYAPLDKLEDKYIATKDGVCILLVQGEFSERSPQENIKRLFSLQPEESAYASDSLFKAQVDAGYDAFVWYNLAALIENIEVKELMMLKSLIKFDDTFATIGVKFEKGKIVVETASVSNPETNKLMLGLVGESGLGDKVLNAMSGDNLLGAAGLKIDMEGILKVLEATQTLSQVNEQLRMANIKAEDIAKAFTGEFGFTFNGIEMVEGRDAVAEMEAMLGDELEDMDIDMDELKEMMSEPTEEPMPRFTITVGYNSLSKVGLMIKGGMSMLAMQGFEKNGDCWTNSEGLSISGKNGCLHLMTTKSLADAYNKGDVAPLDNDIRIALSENHSYTKVDIKKAVGSLVNYEDLKPEIERILEYMPFTILTSTSEVRNNIMVSSMVIEMKDQGEYSLQLIVDFLEKIQSDSNLMM